jgi:hypothetical protein
VDRFLVAGVNGVTNELRATASAYKAAFAAAERAPPPPTAAAPPTAAPPPTATLAPRAGVLAELAPDEPLLTEEGDTSLRAVTLVRTANLPLGSFHITGLFIVYTNKFPACNIARLLGALRPYLLIGLSPKIILPIPQ